MPSLRMLVSLVMMLLAPDILVSQGVSLPSPEYTRRQLERAVTHGLEDGTISSDEAEQSLDLIDQWLALPKNIDQITSEELAEYRLLSPYQIYQFIRYRAEHLGHIATLYDLKNIVGWDEDTALLMAPLLKLGDAPSTAWREGLERGQLQGMLLHTRLSEPSNKHYLGPANSLAFRAQYVAQDRLSIFLGAERDAFEPWQYGSRRGFDSYTGHVAVHQIGVIRSLVVGDYRASWGEGLVLNQGFRMRPPQDIASKASGIRPMRSLAEGERSRGVAADFGRGLWRLLLLYSSQYLDGRINEEGEVIGLSQIGLHRSERELEQRAVVPMHHLGGRFSWEGDRLSLGLGLLRYSFVPNRLRHAVGASHISELSDFTAQNTYSIDYGWMSRSGRLRFSGEVARSSLGGWALVQQMRASGGRLGDWGLALRYVSPTYWAYYGHSHTYKSRPNDEQGFTFFAESRELLHRWQLRLGVDTHRSVSEVGRGWAWVARTTAERWYRPAGYMRATLSYSRPAVGESVFRLSLQRQWQGVRSNLIPYFALSYTPEGWGGALAFRGEVRPSYKLRLWGMLAAYSASWRGRIYLPEPRLSHQYGFTMLHGRGIRLTLGGQWQLSSRWQLGLRAVYSPEDVEVGRNDSQITLGIYFR
ncbi:MAG: hypothetical protein Q4A61_01255 [Porphyromonadaceae bacterium]|nr:hypothetical protein [Porphyromonadaceae bacterium]